MQLAQFKAHLFEWDLLIVQDELLYPNGGKRQRAVPRQADFQPHPVTGNQQSAVTNDAFSWKHINPLVRLAQIIRIVLLV